MNSLENIRTVNSIQKPMKNNLSEAELERLAILNEEAGEVIQIIGKIIRHGYSSYHPDDQDKISNRKLLEKELADLKVAIELMANSGDISNTKIDEFSISKKSRIGKYLHHNRV